MQATQIELTPEERAELESWTLRGKTEQRLALRARIVLAADHLTRHSGWHFENLKRAQ